MIWFDLKKMEKKISKNDISEKESVNYYLAAFIVGSILATIMAVAHKSPNEPNGITAAVYYIFNSAVLVVGILYAYRLNSRIDNRDFFLRFFSLSFVLFIRLITYTICVGLLLLIFIGLFFTLPELNKNLFIYLSLVWRILFYILIALSFKRVSEMKQINEYDGN